MFTKKEIFSRINHIAQENLDEARGMVETLNMLDDEREYFIFNRRVCYKDCHIKDAWSSESFDF